MTALASPAVFGALVVVAIAGAAAGAVGLVALVVRDWRNGKLW